MVSRHLLDKRRSPRRYRRRLAEVIAAGQEQPIDCVLHDISDGGVAVAALEMLFRSSIPGLGLQLMIPSGTDTDRFLFGESVPRILIAFDPSDRVEMESTTQQAGLSFTVVGQTNESGDYLFASLPIGSYDLIVTAQGFKKYQAKGVVLRVAD